jgi:hypothetical protein
VIHRDLLSKDSFDFVTVLLADMIFGASVSWLHPSPLPSDITFQPKHHGILRVLFEPPEFDPFINQGVNDLVHLFEFELERKTLAVLPEFVVQFLVDGDIVMTSTMASVFDVATILLVDPDDGAETTGLLAHVFVNLQLDDFDFHGSLNNICGIRDTQPRLPFVA